MLEWLHIPWQNHLPDHCTPTTAFLTHLSGKTGLCIPTPQAALSTLLGCLSITSWLFAQLPQIYRNYQLKSTAGLSLVFLAEWLLGDTTNLVGAVLTHQAGWQVIVASYYVSVDIGLVVQHFWYSHLKSRFEDGSVHSCGSTINDGGSDMINSLSPINSRFVAEEDEEDPKTQPIVVFKSNPSKPVNMPRFTPVNYEKDRMESPESLRFSRAGSNSSDGSGEGCSSGGGSWSVPASPRTVVYAATMSHFISQVIAAPVSVMAGGHHHHSTPTTAEYVGTLIAWSSTFLYLGSRLPQLYKNWSRQSTAGLSPFLFLAAFCGNLFYTSSLFCNPRAWHNYAPYGGHGWVGSEGSDRREWLAGAAPFFLGAFGCLGLDISIGVQFMLYGEQVEKIVKVRDKDGFSRWEKVSGWMRGWVPTLARERVVDLAESQRILGASREIERLAASNGSAGIVRYGTLS